MKLIERNMAQIIALSEKHKVVSLYVFGSVPTDRLNEGGEVDYSQELPY